ncbi:hypothetical protein E6C27_scaffold270G002990 [Cucumis melo var. makuwa]|uniref:Protein MNN4-like n=1 Tax=Cucumis melo var. makuwa TaxID=1194695 RepID=A0A5A7TAK5_CUCMM|nr:hypothetical protein E6C27_scaffold270G002990 [Cucumis melo var. makuwa]
MTDENIGFMMNLLMEESNRRAKAKEEAEKKQKEDEERATKEKFRKKREAKGKNKDKKGDEGQIEESGMDEPLTEKRMSKLFIVEKGLYLYKGMEPEFLTSLIRALRWMRLFQGGKRVDFGPYTINAIYELENKKIGHVIFKNPKDRDLQEALKKVTWLGTNYDQTLIEKYQL